MHAWVRDTVQPISRQVATVTPPAELGLGGISKRHGWGSEIVLSALRLRLCGIHFYFLLNSFTLSLCLQRWKYFKICTFFFMWTNTCGASGLLLVGSSSVPPPARPFSNTWRLWQKAAVVKALRCKRKTKFGKLEILKISCVDNYLDKAFPVEIMYENKAFWDLFIFDKVR